MELLSWFTRPKAGNLAKGEKLATDRSKRPAQTRKFSGAEIIPHKSSCCNAVRSIAGQRFLSLEVPLIPLRDCDLPRCECTYRRYADRRTSARRAADLGIGLSSGMVGRSGERRNPKAPGRRATDRDAG